MQHLNNPKCQHTTGYPAIIVQFMQAHKKEGSVPSQEMHKYTLHFDLE